MKFFIYGFIYLISILSADLYATCSADLYSHEEGPLATTFLDYRVNLDSQVETHETFDATSFSAASATSNFNVSNIIHDNTGMTRFVTTFFGKIEDHVWRYASLTSGGNISNYAGKTYHMVVVSWGILRFSPDGKLISVEEKFSEQAGDPFLPLDPNLLQAGEMTFLPGELDPETPGSEEDGLLQIRWKRAGITSTLKHTFGEDPDCVEPFTTETQEEFRVLSFEHNGK